MLSLTLFHSLNKVDILYKTLPLTFACRQYQLSLYLLCTAGAYELLKHAANYGAFEIDYVLPILTSTFEQNR